MGKVEQGALPYSASQPQTTTVTDHGSLAGLVPSVDSGGVVLDYNDDHTHYFMIHGRVPGQQAFESREWAETHLGRSEPIGEIDPEIINVAGGSIAIGHPFGATGGRLTLTLASEMRRRDVSLGLISVCAQGGIGFAMVLERA